MIHLPSQSTLALFGLPVGGLELVVLAVLGVLIFGKRLPEVGRSIGKGIVEFKKGLTGFEDELERAGSDEQQHEQQHDGAARIEDRKADASLDEPQTAPPAEARASRQPASDAEQPAAAAHSAQEAAGHSG